MKLISYLYVLGCAAAGAVVSLITRSPHLFQLNFFSDRDRKAQKRL